MTSRGGKESSPWSEWAWIKEAQSWRSEKRDRKGNVVDVEWWNGPAPSATTEPRYTSQVESSSTRQYEELPAVKTQTASNYVFGAPTAQRASGYPDSSTTLTSNDPNSPGVGPPSSGIQRSYPTSTGQHNAFTYKVAPVGLTSSSDYATTPSGWPAPSGIRQQYSTQTPQRTSTYYQGQYDDPTRQTSSSAFQQQSGMSYGETTHLGSQNTTLPTSAISSRSYHQSRASAGSTWSSGYNDEAAARPMASGVPQRYGAALGENTASGYQGENPGPGGQTAPSGFGLNTASTERSAYFPGAPRGRPQSMYVSSGARQDSGVPALQNQAPSSFKGDSVGEITTEMSASTLSGEPRRRAIVYQDRERPSPYEKSKFNSSVPDPEPGTAVVYDEDSEGDMAQEIAKPSSSSRSRRRSSAYTLEDSRRPAVHGDFVVQDPKSITPTQLIYTRDNSRTPRQESMAEPMFNPGDPQLDFARTSTYRDPVDDATRNKSGSATSPYQPEERPIVERPPLKRHESNKNYPKVSGKGQPQSRGSEWDIPSYEAPAPTNPQPQQYPFSERRIKTKYPNKKNEPLHPEFCTHESKSFRRGRVFKIMWSEPLGGNADEDASDETILDDESCVKHAKHGQKAYHTIRRFVIVKAREGHCLCVPILTYGGQGTLKPGIKAKDHAIIYTGKDAPKPLPGEKDIHKRPVRVDNIDPRGKLSAESRVNYNKIYTVEHNVKVCFIGKIHDDSKATFFTDFEETFAKE